MHLQLYFFVYIYLVSTKMKFQYKLVVIDEKDKSGYKNYKSGKSKMVGPKFITIIIFIYEKVAV